MFALSSALVLSILSGVARADCESDAECKGDRVCRAGSCVDPGVRSGPTARERREERIDEARRRSASLAVTGGILGGAGLVFASVGVAGAFAEWSTPYPQIAGVTGISLLGVGIPLAAGAGAAGRDGIRIADLGRMDGAGRAVGWTLYAAHLASGVGAIVVGTAGDAESAGGVGLAAVLLGAGSLIVFEIDGGASRDILGLHDDAEVVRRVEFAPIVQPTQGGGIVGLSARY